MKDVFKEFNEIEWRTYDTFSALEAVEAFWKNAERLISEDASIEDLLGRPKWVPKTQEEAAEYSAERQVATHLHYEILTPTLRYSAVVMLFATFEREIRRFGENVAKETQAAISYKDLRGSLLEQVATYLGAFLKISPKNLHGHEVIKDLQKVRNCVVHCYGDASLTRNDLPHLRKLETDKRGLTVVEGAPMEIEAQFIEESLTACREYFRELFESVGWKVNARWLAK